MDNESLNWFRFAKCLADAGNKVLRRYLYLHASTCSLSGYHDLWQQKVKYHCQSNDLKVLWTSLNQHSSALDATSQLIFLPLLSKWKCCIWGAPMEIGKQLSTLESWKIDLQDTISKNAAQQNTLSKLSRPVQTLLMDHSIFMTTVRNWTKDFIHLCHMNQLDLLYLIEQHNERTSSLMSTFLRQLDIMYIGQGSEDLKNALKTCQQDEGSSSSELKTNTQTSFISWQSEIDTLINSWAEYIPNCPNQTILQHLLTDMRNNLPAVHKTCQVNVNNICSTWHINLQKELAELNHQLQQVGESTLDLQNFTRKWHEKLKAFLSISDLQTKEFFDSKKTDLQSLKRHHIITEPQWSLIFPSQGSINLQAFDITLSAILLRNICPVFPPEFGWSGEILDTDHSFGADLIRLKMYRNNLNGHIPHLSLPDSDFEKIWGIMETILHRLSMPIGNEFWQEVQEKITELRTCSFGYHEEMKLEGILIPRFQGLEEKSGNINICLTGALMVHEEQTTTRISQEFLGKGRFGKVFKAYDDSSNITMAVKIVEHCGSSSETEISGSIKSEIEILQKLDHDRIIKYYRCVEKETSIEIFLEYMPNGSVKDYMSKHEAPFSEHRTAELTRDVLEGVIYLHTNNILHRDLKGANVLLDYEMKAKLCDFGVSKKIETLTNSNTCCDSYVGTAYWSSPEIIKGEKYGKKTDIWSIGCTLVEMLTMHPPWHEFETLTAIFKIGLGMYPTYQLPETTSTALNDFLSQTFQQEAKERPKASELLKHSFLGGDQPHMSD